MANFNEVLAKFLAQNQFAAVAFLVWTLFWKGLALWRAGRNNQLYWFVGLLVINFLGIPEITYVFFFQKENKLADVIVNFFKKRKGGDYGENNRKR